MSVQVGPEYAMLFGEEVIMVTATLDDAPEASFTLAPIYSILSTLPGAIGYDAGFIVSEGAIVTVTVDDVELDEEQLATYFTVTTLEGIDTYRANAGMLFGEEVIMVTATLDDAPEASFTLAPIYSILSTLPGAIGYDAGFIVSEGAVVTVTVDDFELDVDELAANFTFSNDPDTGIDTYRANAGKFFGSEVIMVAVTLDDAPEASFTLAPIYSILSTLPGAIGYDAGFIVSEGAVVTVTVDDVELDEESLTTYFTVTTLEGIDTYRANAGMLFGEEVIMVAATLDDAPEASFTLAPIYAILSTLPGAIGYDAGFIVSEGAVVTVTVDDVELDEEQLATYFTVTTLEGIDTYRANAGMLFGEEVIMVAATLDDAPEASFTLAPIYAILSTLPGAIGYDAGFIVSEGAVVTVTVDDVKLDEEQLATYFTVTTLEGIDTYRANAGKLFGEEVITVAATLDDAPEASFTLAPIYAILSTLPGAIGYDAGFIVSEGAVVTVTVDDVELDEEQLATYFTVTTLEGIDTYRANAGMLFGEEVIMVAATLDDAPEASFTLAPIYAILSALPGAIGYDAGFIVSEGAIVTVTVDDVELDEESLTTYFTVTTLEGIDTYRANAGMLFGEEVIMVAATLDDAPEASFTLAPIYAILSTLPGAIGYDAGFIVTEGAIVTVTVDDVELDEESLTTYFTVTTLEGIDTYRANAGMLFGEEVIMVAATLDDAPEASFTLAPIYAILSTLPGAIGYDAGFIVSEGAVVTVTVDDVKLDEEQLATYFTVTTLEGIDTYRANAGKLFGEEVITVAATLDDAPEASFTLAPIYAILSTLPGAIGYDAGFIVSEGAVVTVTVDDVELDEESLTAYFTVTTLEGIDTYRANAGKFFGEEVIMVAATLDDAPEASFTLAPIYAILSALPGAIGYDAGFIVSEGAVVTVTVDDVELDEESLTAYFTVTTLEGIDTYRANAGKFFGEEVIMVAATLDDAPEASFTLAPIYAILSTLPGAIGYDAGFIVSEGAVVTVTVDDVELDEESLTTYFTVTTLEGIDTYRANAGMLFGEEVIMVAATLDDAPESSFTLAPIYAILSTLPGAIGFDAGFIVSEGAIVTVTVDDVELDEESLTAYFTVTTLEGIDTYRANAGMLFGEEVITVAATLDDAPEASFTLAPIYSILSTLSGAIGFDAGFIVSEGAVVTVTVDDGELDEESLTTYFTVTTLEGIDTYRANAGMLFGEEVIMVTATLDDAPEASFTLAPIYSILSTLPGAIGYDAGFIVSEGAIVTVTVDDVELDEEQLATYFTVTTLEGIDTYRANAGMLFGEEVIMVTATLDDAPEASFTLAPIYSILSTLPGAIGYDAGFIVSEGAVVTVTVDDFELDVDELAANFTFSNDPDTGIDTYRANAGKFFGSEVIMVAVTLDDAPEASFTLAPIYSILSTLPGAIGYDAGFIVSEGAVVTVTVDDVELDEESLTTYFTVTTLEGIDTYRANAGMLFGEEVIMVAATLDDAPEASFTLAPIYAILSTLPGAIGYDAGFIVSEGAVVTVTVDDVELDEEQLATYFTVTTLEGIDTYRANAGMLFGEEVIMVAATLDDAPEASFTLAPIYAILSTLPGAIGYDAGFIVSEGAVVTVTVDDVKLDEEQLATYFTVTTLEGIDTYRANAGKLFGEEVITVAATLDDAPEASFTLAPIYAILSTLPGAIGYDAGFIVSEGAVVTVTVDDVELDEEQLATYFTVTTLEGIDTYRANAGMLFGEEVIMVAATLDDAPEASLNLAPIYAILSDLPSAIGYHAGFIAIQGAAVTVTVDGVELGADELAANFTFSNDPDTGLDTYRANAGKFFGSEVITVAATLDDAPDASFNLAPVYAILSTLPGAIGYDAGFIVTEGAVVTVTVDDVELDEDELAAYFTVTTLEGIDTYTANAGKFIGEEAITVAATLDDAPDSNLSLAPIDSTAPDASNIELLTGKTSFLSGFSVDEGSEVTVFVDGLALSESAMATKFIFNGETDGIDFYRAKANAFTGKKIDMIVATLTDEVGNVSASSTITDLKESTITLVNDLLEAQPDNVVITIDLTAPDLSTSATGYKNYVPGSKTAIAAEGNYAIDLTNFNSTDVLKISTDFGPPALKNVTTSSSSSNTSSIKWFKHSSEIYKLAAHSINVNSNATAIKLFSSYNNVRKSMTRYNHKYTITITTDHPIVPSQILFV